MDISTHPVVIVIGTLAALVSVAAAVWGALTYIRKRWVAPFIQFVHDVQVAAEMVPRIKAQLLTNGGSSLRDAVDLISRRVGLIEAQGNALMQENDMGVFRTDSDGKTVWVNRTYCRLLGCTESDAMGYGWKNCIADNEREEYFREWKSAITDGREFIRHVRMFTADEGRELVFKVRAYPMGANQPGYIGFMEIYDPRPIAGLLPPVSEH